MVRISARLIMLLSQCQISESFSVTLNNNSVTLVDEDDAYLAL